MKKIVFLLLAVLAVSTFWYFQKEPTFNGLYPQTQKDIWLFHKENYKESKYAMAMRIYSQVEFMQKGKDNPDWLNAENKTIGEARDYVFEIQNMAKEFESKLSSDEISKITQSNPYSFLRTINMFWSQIESLDCTQEEFSNLMNQIDPSEFANRGKDITILASSFDYQYKEDYVKEVINLLQTDPKYQSYKILSEEYYPTKLTPIKITPEALKNLAQGLSSDSDEFNRASRWISTSKDRLIKSGVPESSVESYALNKAKLSPACLGKVTSIGKIWFKEALKSDPR